MSSIQCPYCSASIPICSATCRTYTPSFEESCGFSVRSNGTTVPCDSKINITFYKCPECGQYTIFLSGSGEKVKDVLPMPIRPLSLAQKFPSYVPEAIRQDYEEAYAIVNLSPKASSTLSRRCIQGMIHDKWNIVLKNLNQEITAIKDLIDPELWNAIDSVRQIGNIGAHMEKDVNIIININSGEAEKLLKLVEILIRDWYIVPHERSVLLSDIIQLNDIKQNQRKESE